MKKIVLTISLFSIVILAYFLFEPVFTYYFGRSITLNRQSLYPDISHLDSVRNKADELLAREFQTINAPSLSASIGMGDSVIWSNSIGYSDLDNNLLADTTTKYRIGSVSKTIASVGLGLLFQDRILSPNSTVGDYVTYVSGDLANLTVKELASHTSGIRNYGMCFCFPIWEYYNNDQFNTTEKSVSVFADDKLLFTSGQDFSYSSFNYTLLTAVMEGASKTGYNQFIQSRVLEPLNLQHTIPDNALDPVPNTAIFYDSEESYFKKSYPVNNSNKWAGGGYLSTPTDLVKFGNGILNYKLVNSTTTELLFNPVELKSGEVNVQNYALGWRNDVSKKVFVDGREVIVVHHGGTAVGSTAILMLLPEYNVSIALAMNSSGETTDLFALAYKIIDLFFE
ncbi:serine hydrolase [Algoriphagus halophytocola]|uniref:Beta-lactamase family protein n=1 Tax=Algoriphagus halophytocola TaxID=2991499 RepID=A0ABY6MJX8_9BACT|nr:MULTISPECIES: serine hydrolase domain-containing protein [unclassified Algoriphagus]UZD24075.1 beta-lactamase family protein [Algoriphagus sp. TR-M5]WBL41446.1 serine hydrolase [Algoriphagus sp. TR-M9]